MRAVSTGAHCRHRATLQSRQRHQNLSSKASQHGGIYLGRCHSPANQSFACSWGGRVDVAYVEHGIRCKSHAQRFLRGGLFLGTSLGVNCNDAARARRRIAVGRWCAPAAPRRDTEANYNTYDPPPVAPPGVLEEEGGGGGGGGIPSINFDFLLL